MEEEREKRADLIREAREKERGRENARRNPRTRDVARFQDGAREEQQRAHHRELLGDIKPIKTKVPMSISTKLRIAKTEGETPDLCRPSDVDRVLTLGMASPSTAVKQTLDDLPWNPPETTTPLAYKASQGW